MNTMMGIRPRSWHAAVYYHGYRSMGTRASSPLLQAATISVQDSPYAQTHTAADVINFGLGQPSASLLPIELFDRVAQHRFQPDHDRSLLQYGSGIGYVGFRQSLASFLSRACDHQVSPESLMVTAGNSQAISHAAMMISASNTSSAKRVIVEEPTYFLAYDIFRELGFEIQSVPVDAGGLNLDALEEKLVEGGAPSCLYTIPFFQNPTGAVLPDERCARLIDLAERYEFSIISDEPYNLLSLSGENHRSLASRDPFGRVISLGSFSKILAPGLRLGWAESSVATIQGLTSCGPIRSGGGQNPMTAAMVHQLLEDNLLQPHINHLKTTFAHRKRVMSDALRESCPACSFVEPMGGYFVWVKLPPGMTADSLLTEATQRHGVAFTPGSRCSLQSTTADAAQYIRLSFAFYEAEEIQDGIQRLAAALQAA